MTQQARHVGHDRYVVARADEIPVGGRLLVEVGGREVGVFNVDGEFFAVLNRCPHLGGPLCRGQMLNTVTSTGPGDVQLDASQDMLTCPWHNWEFDIRTGQSYWDPAKLRARPFPVGVEGGVSVAEQVETGAMGRVKGPYKAETLPVETESEYVVLTLRRPRPEQTPATQTPQTEGAPS